jgi:hypothetical protein
MLRPGRLGRASEGKNYYEGASAIFSTMLLYGSGQAWSPPRHPDSNRHTWFHNTE